MTTNNRKAFDIIQRNKNKDIKNKAFLKVFFIKGFFFPILLVFQVIETIGNNILI